MVAWPAGNISGEATTSRGNTIYEATRQQRYRHFIHGAPAPTRVGRFRSRVATMLSITSRSLGVVGASDQATMSIRGIPGA